MSSTRTSVEAIAMKNQRRVFADLCARRIGRKMHAALDHGEPVTVDQWLLWWREEARKAKAAGLYSSTTYDADAASGLRGMAEQRGWGLCDE